mmetsp:Transcript_2525/g.16654  ORF Transcript_2525/g.16654 Transcript_2525/m.16654 type:complete len:294 (+) Transcript_2525:2234-3115(+)
MHTNPPCFVDCQPTRMGLSPCLTENWGTFQLPRARMHGRERDDEVARLVYDALGTSPSASTSTTSDLEATVDREERLEICSCLSAKIDVEPHVVVDGLYVFRGGLCNACERNLLEDVMDEGVVAGTNNQAMRFGQFPIWAEREVERVHHLLRNASQLYPTLEPFAQRNPTFNQMIINKYSPGEGINNHVDLQAFADGILSISLGSSCVMVFQQLQGTNREEVILHRGDVLFMCGSARYEWEHGIPARTSDMWGGSIQPRGMRISLTFRKMKDEVHILHEEAPASCMPGVNQVP